MGLGMRMKSMKWEVNKLHTIYPDVVGIEFPAVKTYPSKMQSS